MSKKINWKKNHVYKNGFFTNEKGRLFKPDGKQATRSEFGKYSKIPYAGENLYSFLNEIEAEFKNETKGIHPASREYKEIKESKIIAQKTILLTYGKKYKEPKKRVTEFSSYLPNSVSIFEERTEKLDPDSPEYKLEVRRKKERERKQKQRIRLKEIKELLESKEERKVLIPERPFWNVIGYGAGQMSGQLNKTMGLYEGSGKQVIIRFILNESEGESRVETYDSGLALDHRIRSLYGRLKSEAKDNSGGVTASVSTLENNSAVYFEVEINIE